MVLVSNMPRKKKTPVAQKTKATKKTPTKKVNVKDGSYLDSQTDVSTNFGSDALNVPLTASSDPNATLVACLQRLEESNKDIVRCMGHLEHQHSVNSTPLSSPTHRLQTSSGTQAEGGSHPSTVHALSSQGASPRHGSTASHLTGQSKGVEARNFCLGSDIHHKGYRDRHPTQPEIHDAVIPSLEAIRKSEYISQSVARILNHYEESAKQQTLQGKGHSGKKSGRFNTTETCTAPPELRWPNEGFVGGANRKRLSYDDMSIPQWVAGQLNNISQIQDNSLLRLVLDQVIAAMRDASSLPWVAVRGAWASSMHDMEEGRLTWRDTTQWAINRLSNAQVAMLNSQAVSQSKGRVCMYYNEGTCSFDAHHGMYKHFCAHCLKFMICVGYFHLLTLTNIHL